MAHNTCKVKSLSKLWIFSVKHIKAFLHSRTLEYNFGWSRGLWNVRQVPYTCAIDLLQIIASEMWLWMHMGSEKWVRVVKTLALKGYWKHKGQRGIQNRIYNGFKVLAVLVYVLSGTFTTAWVLTQPMALHGTWLHTPKHQRMLPEIPQFRFENLMNYTIVLCTKAFCFYWNIIS